MTDAMLIKEFLKGEVGAFNTLVWRWEKPLYYFVYRTVGNSETAKDICQSAFIRAYKELRKLRDHEKFSPWMYRIALNLCRDELKKKSRRNMVSYEDLLYSKEDSHSLLQFPDSDTKSPEELVDNQQLGEILKRALQAIPEEQRVVIVMKQYQGLKFTEIADIIKQPVNTVKSRLYYGLRALRKILVQSQFNKEVLLNEM